MSLEEFNERYTFISLTSDRFLKVFFYNNIDLLKRFVISLLNLNLDFESTKIKVLKVAFTSSTISEYLKTADFNVLINNKIIVNIEFNNMKFENVKERNFVYLSKLITSILKSGDNPNSLKSYDVYQVNVNANTYDRNTGIREVMNLYLDNFDKYLPNVRIFEIGLEYFRNLLYTEDKTFTKREYMLASFKSKSIVELDSILSKFVSDDLKKKIEKEVMLIMSDVEIVFTEEEVRAMDAMMMASYEADLKADVEREKKAIYNEAMQQGLSQGIKQGIKQGIEQGLSQGIEQGIKQKSINVAKNLLSQNISLDVIKKATGLSIKTIKSLL